MPFIGVACKLSDKLKCDLGQVNLMVFRERISGYGIAGIIAGIGAIVLLSM